MADEKTKTPDKKAAAPASPALPDGVKAGAFLIAPAIAFAMSHKPEEFPGATIHACVKRGGTKSGKDYYAIAYPDCPADILAKIKGA